MTTTGMTVRGGAGAAAVGLPLSDVLGVLDVCVLQIGLWVVTFVARCAAIPIIPDLEEEEEEDITTQGTHWPR